MKINIQNLKKEKINSMLDEALNASETEILIAELQANQNIDEISETKGYELTLEYADQENVTLENLFIYFSPETVIEVSKKTDATSIDKIIAHVTEENGNKKVVKRLAVIKETIQLLAEIPFKKSYFDFFTEKVENDVIAEAWYDGCLVFGDPETGYYFYRHCGAGCGDNGSTGGGTPINELDRCCRAHDRCWAAFGEDDCDCDQNLGECAETTTDPGWYLVATWAYEKSCN